MAILATSNEQTSSRRVGNVGVPDSKAGIQPTSVFLPSPSWDGVDTHKDISLAELHRFPTIDESVRS